MKNYILIIILFLFFSGKVPTEKTPPDWYLEIGGDTIEVYSDQFGNSYLKQYIRLDKKAWLYIPFKGQYDTDFENDIMQYTGVPDNRFRAECRSLAVVRTHNSFKKQIK